MYELENLQHCPDEIVRIIFDAVSEVSAGPGEPVVSPLQLDCSNPDAAHLRVRQAIGPRYTNLHALASTCRRFYEFYRTVYIETIDLRNPPNTVQPPKYHRNTMAELRQRLDAKDTEHAADFTTLKRILRRFPQVSSVVLVFASCYPQSLWKELADASQDRLRAIHLSNWCRTWARLFIPTWLDSGWLQNIGSANSVLRAITAEAALLTPEDLKSISRCSSLQALSLSGYFENESPPTDPNYFTESDQHERPADYPFLSSLISSIHSMQHLRSLRLSLSFHHIETISLDAVIAALPPGFQSLSLEGRQFGITTTGMKHLSKTALHSLCIKQNLPFNTWATFAPVASQLRELELHGCLSSNERSGVETLAEMRSLRRFHFHNDPYMHHGISPGYERACPAADALVQIVFDLPSVDDVAIAGSNCTDDGVARAVVAGRASERIEALSFECSLFVADATLAAVATSCRALRTLNMCGTAASRDRLGEFDAPENGIAHTGVLY